MSRFAQGLLGVLALLLAFKAAAEGLTLPPAGDIRVLIDISGSMKKNDPNNLRQPALNLITQLLPEGSKAGVWTFGQYVNELVPHRPVDAAWRDLARSKAREISSVALFTNIGGVLERSFDDFQDGKSYENTHFILLTDGVVDISKEEGANVRERQRIVAEILSRFKRAGAHVHTIALSRNADLTLLDRLALDTGGIATVAETADDLTRVFLQTFERAAPPEEVPLEGNTFATDSNVQEFTALVFRKRASDRLGLVEPSGQTYTEKNRPDYVNWYADQGYDLITVKRPLEGEWRIDGELGDGSRVTVVSNLRMIVDPLPANFFAGDQLEVRTGFFEDGQLVTDANFLRLIGVDVTIRNQDGKSGTRRISDEQSPPADGLFREKITKLRDVGVYEVIVDADGRTFKRKSRQRIELSPPLAIEVEATGTGETTAYKVLARTLSPHIDKAGTAIVARIKAPDGGNLIKSLVYNEGLDQWEMDVEPVRGDGVYEVALRVDGKTVQGLEFRFDPSAVQAEFPRQEASPNEYRSLVDESTIAGINETLIESSEVSAEALDPAGVIDPAALAAAQAEQAAAESAEAGETETTDASEEPNWLLWSAIAGGAALALAIGGLGFWAWRRKRNEREILEKRTGKGKAEREKEKQAPPAKADTKAAAAAAAAPVAATAVADLEDEIEQLESPTVDDDLDFTEPPMDSDLEPEVPEFDQPEAVSGGGSEPAPELDDISGLSEADLEADMGDITEEELQAADAEEEFNLEDFDIGDTDDLDKDKG